jgi:peptidoglycan/LPS O-acetylase OafA/YrhL
MINVGLPAVHNSLRSHAVLGEELKQPASVTRTKLHHRPEIDGLRALAVIPVILFHARIAPFWGGFIGVDVFFVISGFLITTIIIEALEREKFSFFEFYSRRVRRILPVLVFVVLVTISAAWLIMLPEDFKQFAESVGAVGAFSSNLLFWWKSGYFAASTENKPLLHTWSLAVEEQYYIVFPLLLLAVWRLRHRRVALVLASVFAASLVLSQWTAHAHPDFDFYLAPTRAWELMIGSLAALWVHRFGLRPNSVLGLIGLAMIVASVFIFDSQTPFPSLYALLPTVGATAVLMCADGSTPVGRLLSMRAPVMIGLISYSAYLWHQPIFALIRIALRGAPSPLTMLALSVAILGLAYLSWRFIEQPFRKARWPARKVVAAGAAASIGLMALGALLVVSGVQKRSFMATLSPARAHTLSMIEAVSNKPFTAIDDGACRFGVHLIPTDADGLRMTSCTQRLGRGIIVLGDSHAKTLQRALIASGDAPQFLVQIDKGADCQPIPRPGCLTGVTASFLVKHKDDIRSVIYEQAGFYLLLAANGAPGTRDIFVNQDSPVATVSAPAISGVAEYLDGLQARLGLHVIWIGPWLEPYIPMERLLGFDCEDAPKYLRPDPAKDLIFENLDAAISTASAGHKYRYVSAMRAIGFDARHDVIDCSNIYWMDGDHFSPAGESRFGKRLVPMVGAIKP